MRNDKVPTKNLGYIESRFPLSRADPDLISPKRHSDHLSQPDHCANADQRTTSEQSRPRTRAPAQPPSLASCSGSSSNVDRSTTSSFMATADP